MKKVSAIVLTVIIVLAALLNIADRLRDVDDTLYSGLYFRLDNSMMIIMINDDQTFAVKHVFESSMPSGNYTVEDGSATLIFDEDNKYTFNIVNKTLRYNAALSTIKPGAYPVYEGIEDGQSFVLK